ncbi:MAG: hypothetical protein HY296_01075 [Thaumarchaeota archaeon]|nr:hypothetical protein [Nitrososphaerota archaeon]
MMKTGGRNSRITRATVALGLSLSMTALAFAGSGTVISAPAFNNIQVFVTTGADFPYTFAFSAYNLTGSLVGSYQSPYPAAAFELPSGDYLITVGANYQNFGCRLCLSGGASPPSGGNGTVTEPSYPIYYQPKAEYGYQLVHVAGPATININTQNISAIPTTSVTVKVHFVNGTAAANASVSASIVGEWYYWWGSGTKTSMWGQTDQNGVAILTIPVAPAVVTAWDWVKVPVPSNASTVSTDVGGQTVNVTVYWQPTYIGLTASGMILPPQDSLNLTLHYEEISNWVFPAGVEYSQAQGKDSANATLSDQPTGVPSGASPGSGQSGNSQGYYTPSQIPAIQAGGELQSVGQQGPLGGVLLWAMVGGTVVAVTGAAIALSLARRRRANGSSAPAG